MHKIKEYKKEFFLILFLIICFIFNTIFDYFSYKNFKSENIFETETKIINIYEKDDYDILRLKTKSFEFFSSINKNEDLNKFDSLITPFEKSHWSLADGMNRITNPDLLYSFV